ncbi:Uncharacterized protein SCF082_LOCUS22226 [Durusdinium trenchii]|uniref:DUF2135 domain-containing protein n=1 Tax=Durusdinium trenchii TaxID=1381693 RepID=A0ABP0LGZ9_9DINO
MVWLLTIAALAVGLYSLARRNSELAAINHQLADKNKQYRKEFGIFEVEDSTKINTMDMSPRRDSSSILGRRQYCVYLPPGREYFLKYQVNNIPADGLGDCPESRTLKPGEYEVRISVAFERDSNQKRTGLAVGAISFRPVNISGASAIRHELRLSEVSADWIINEDTGGMEYITEDIGRVRDIHNDRIAGEREVELHDADQFSLLTMVWLLTIAALAVGLYSSGRRNTILEARNEELEAENKTYRNVLGVFDVEDPKKIHAIRAPSENDEPRKYRIYLPPGRKYVACYQANRIPERGVGEYPNPNVLAPGTYVIKVKINRNFDRDSGEPTRSVGVDFEIDPADEQVHTSSSAKIGISEMWNDWIVNKQTGGMAYSWAEIGRVLELHDPTEPLVLYRARAHDIKVHARNKEGRVTSYSSKNIEGPTDGFMVWIEPQEEK